MVAEPVVGDPRTSTPSEGAPGFPASPAEWELIGEDEATTEANITSATALWRQLTTYVLRLFFKRRCWHYLGQHLKNYTNLRPRPPRSR